MSVLPIDLNLNIWFFERSSTAIPTERPATIANKARIIDRPASSAKQGKAFSIDSVLSQEDFSANSFIEKLHSISEHSSNDLHKEHVTSFNYHILAENLSFSYDTQTQVLNEMNCIIEKGKKYAVIGKSGCGKSTFIKLLTGYYSDYKGTLLYDDRELTQLVKEDVVQLSSIIIYNFISDFWLSL